MFWLGALGVLGGERQTNAAMRDIDARWWLVCGAFALATSPVAVGTSSAYCAGVRRTLSSVSTAFEMYASLISSTFGTGVEASHRRLKAPFLDLGEILYNARTEDSIASYAYWLPTNRLAISIQPRIQRIKGGDSFDEMDLQELPISTRLAFPCGLWLGVSLTGVWQKGIFDGPGGVPNQGKDHFEVVDTLIAFRIPRRLGTISLEVNNIFNKSFQFQETDLSALPRYVPERRVFARLSLAL